MQKQNKKVGKDIHAEKKAIVTASDVLRNVFGETISLPVNLTEVARKYGISVRHASFKPPYATDLYGYIAKRDGEIKITVNSENSYGRKRFTIAHELAHYFLHHDQKEIEFLDLRSTERDDKERAADAFAAELLMPETCVREEHDKLMFPTVRQLALVFGVSEEAMYYRLKNLQITNVIGKDQYERRYGRIY